MTEMDIRREIETGEGTGKKRSRGRGEGGQSESRVKKCHFINHFELLWSENKAKIRPGPSEPVGPRITRIRIPSSLFTAHSFSGSPLSSSP